MFLITKVNVPIYLFQGILKPLQSCTIKKNYKEGEGYQFMKKCRSLWLPDDIKLSVEIIYNG